MKIKKTSRFAYATSTAVFLFLILLFIPIIVKSITYISLIPAAAAISTIYFGLTKYWIDADLMFKTLFREFNERFDLLNEDLNNVDSEIPVKGQKTKEQIIQDYLNLCAEEYYWYQKGRIPEEVWTSWHSGIINYLSKPSIKLLFLEQLQYNSSYYGFLTIVKEDLN